MRSRHFETNLSEEALYHYASRVGRQIACVADVRPNSRLYVAPTRHEFEVSLPLPSSLQRIQGGPSGLRFDFQILVQPVRVPNAIPIEWEVEALAYEYRLLDHRARELLVYHWQPDAAGPDFPHNHVSASLDAQVEALNGREIPLDKRHVVTD